MTIDFILEYTLILPGGTRNNRQLNENFLRTLTVTHYSTPGHFRVSRE